MEQEEKRSADLEVQLAKFADDLLAHEEEHEMERTSATSEIILLKEQLDGAYGLFAYNP